MALITYIILLGLFNISLQNCVIDNTPLHIVWEKRLRTDLKCNFTYYGPPKTANNLPLTVDVRFIMKYFTFSSDNEVLTLQVWMFVSWIDERLKWDPAKYDGINETEIASSSIWAPSFLLYNSADSEDFDRYYFIRCSLKSSGSVLCVPRLVHNIRCRVNLADFPYDVQKCKVQYGPWDHHDFNINVSSKAMNMWGAGYGSQWTITDYSQESDAGSAVQLNMTLVFEREAMSLASVIVYPSLIISGLTIACLFLDVRTNVRLGLVCFSIYAHYFWMTELGENIPRENAVPPRILLYYRGTMILTVLILPLTFILSVACKKTTVPHNVIISINNFVYGGFARFLVFPRWEIDGIELTDENKYVEDWTKFANLVNSFCINVVLVAYIGLYIAFMPQPVPLNVD